MSASLPRPDRAGQWLALAGLLAPGVFTVAWLAAGLLRPGYDPVRDDTSALSAADAPNGWLVSGGLALAGLLLGLFALGLRRWLGRADGRRLGPALLLAIAVGCIALGLLPEDAPGISPPGDRGTLTNQLHDAVSLVVYLALIVAPPLLARDLPPTPAWRRLRRAAGLIGLATLLLVGLYLARALPWSGLVQRLLVSLPLLWLAWLALRLVRTSAPHGEPEPQQAG
jgi:hypothetical membrane protein